MNTPLSTVIIDHDSGMISVRKYVQRNGAICVECFGMRFKSLPPIHFSEFSDPEQWSSPLQELIDNAPPLITPPPPYFKSEEELP